jgi:hypothetical protein
MKNQVKEMAQFLQNSKRSDILTEAEYFYRSAEDWKNNSADQLDKNLVKKIEKIALLLNATPEAVDDKNKQVVYNMNINGSTAAVIAPAKLASAGVKDMQFSIDNHWGDLLVITVLK